MSASFSPGLLFVSTAGGTKCVEQLVGKAFCSISSGRREAVAACKDGAFAVASNGDVDSICSMKLKSVVQGSGFYVAVDAEQTLYSWGSNCFSGQLGQGACHQTILAPAQIAHSAKFVSASCGDSFVMALDETGGAYAWGENSDRQLGLYTKTQGEMHLSNSVIENLSFVPRLIPLSLSHSVTKVSCGVNFSVVITKGGILYSWGAGECGQLGTGRCTKREVPAPILLIDNGAAGDSPVSAVTPLLVRDVACGTSHAVAASEDGKLYCWGLNKSNQLGLDNFRTQHFPVPAPVLVSSVVNPNDADSVTAVVVPDVTIAQVFAHGHSSAAIDTRGRLFTWGSTAHDRLMHVLPLQPPAPPLDVSLTYSELRTKRMACARGNVGHFKASKAQALFDAAVEKSNKRLPISNIVRPTFVQTPDLYGCSIDSFAFASTHSVALVLTCLKKAWPTEGPRRSFSKLQLRGDGFWNSPNIIVKFSFVRSNWSALPVSTQNHSRPSTSRLPPEPTFNPPRSCAGVFVDSSTISCKPPKFSECGVYSVSVSMDGSHFLPQTVEIFVHHELSVLKQMPELCDMSSTAKIGTMEIHVAGLPSPPLDWSGEYHVRWQFSCIEGAASLAHMSAGSSASHSIGVSSKTGAGASRASAVLPSDDYHFTTVARLVASPSAAPSTRATSPSGDSQHDTDNEESAGGNAGVPAPPEEPVLTVLVCSDVDLSEFQRRAGHSLYELRCQVSLNGQDFSSLKPPSQTAHRHRSSSHSHAEPGTDGVDPGAKSLPVTLLYSVNPVAAEPSCASIDRFSTPPPQIGEGEAATTENLVEVPAMEVVVKGSSLIPLHRLPKGSRIDAILTPSLGDMEWQDGFAPQWSNAGESLLPLLPQAVCTVRCEHTTSLTISIGPAAETVLRTCIGWINAVASGANLPESPDHMPPEGMVQYIDTLSLNISFYMHVGEQAVPLAGQVDPVTLKLYRNKQLELVPSCCNALVDSPLDCTLLVKRAATAAELQQGLSFPAGSCADGFAFYSAEAVVAVHVPISSSDENAGETGDGSATPLRFLPPVILQPSEFRFVSLLLLPEHTGVRQDIVPSEENEDTNQGQLLDAAGGESDPINSHAEVDKPIIKHLMQLQLPPASRWLEVVRGALGDAAANINCVPHVYVSCWLDGKSMPPENTWAKLTFYRNLTVDYAINPPAPKIGFVPENSISVDLAAYCPTPLAVHPAILNACVAAVEQQANGLEQAGDITDGHEDLRPVVPQQCVVRIRGAPTDDFPDGCCVDVAGVLSESAADPSKSTIMFDIPEAVKTTEGMMPVQKTPKDKTMYFVDVSVDGGLTFDAAEVPLLFLK